MYRLADNNEVLSADLAELVVDGAASVHERLRNDGEARITDMRLVDVEHEVGVLDDVHPEPQRQTVGQWERHICDPAYMYQNRKKTHVHLKV